MELSGIPASAIYINVCLYIHIQIYLHMDIAGESTPEKIEHVDEA